MSLRIISPLFPHRRASELFDAKLDGLIDESDAAFLDAHLDRCAECRASFESKQRAVEALRSLGTAKAPAGFAGRVMLAARARGRAEVSGEEVAALRPRWWQLVSIQQAVAASFLVAVLGAAGVVVSMKTDKGGDTLKSAGAALAQQGAHFVVRAPGIGAAKLRSQVIATLQAHQGTHSDRDGSIVARIPRGELIGVTQDLAGKGKFKMTKADELPVDAKEVIIRFEIE